MRLSTKTKYMPLAQMSDDELPYTCNPMPYAQPDRLATVATLFGMTPPPVQTARVLELGCCDGSNIIPTAVAKPNATVWGVDISAQQIAKGRTLIEALGLQNITLEQKNLLEIDESFGIFDYIIAHGIYSWVSPLVQKKILRICQHHLAANGVAYVSYNTKPGWNMRSTLRDMMLYYSSMHSTDSDLQSKKLKTWLQLIADTATKNQDAYSHFLSEELNHFRQLPESFICQDFLEEENKPLYFYQFIEQARVHGLAYLGDAFLPTMLPHSFPPPVLKMLRRFRGDLIEQEQIIDFLSNRRFRHTCLCHQDIPLNRTLSPDLLHPFYIASGLQPVTDTTSQSVQQFKNARGTLSTDKPIIQAALRYLNKQCFRPVAFTELLEKAREEVGKTTSNTQDQAILAEALFKCYSTGLIEVYGTPPQFVTIVSQQPQASQLARWQAARRQRVTNLRCEWITIENAVCLQLLPYLDGSRNHTALLDLLNEWVQSGKLSINIKSQQAGKRVTLNEEQKHEILGKILDDVLRLMAKAGLLIA